MRVKLKAGQARNDQGLLLTIAATALPLAEYPRALGETFHGGIGVAPLEVDVAQNAQDLGDEAVVGAEGELGNAQDLGVDGQSLVGLAAGLVDLAHGAADDGDVLVVRADGPAEDVDGLAVRVHGLPIPAGVLQDLTELVQRIGHVGMELVGCGVEGGPADGQGGLKGLDGFGDGVVEQLHHPDVVQGGADLRLGRGGEAGQFLLQGCSTGITSKLGGKVRAVSEGVLGVADALEGQADVVQGAVDGEVTVAVQRSADAQRLPPELDGLGGIAVGKVKAGHEAEGVDDGGLDADGLLPLLHLVVVVVVLLGGSGRLEVGKGGLLEVESPGQNLDGLGGIVGLVPHPGQIVEDARRQSRLDVGLDDALGHVEELGGLLEGAVGRMDEAHVEEGDGRTAVVVGDAVLLVEVDEGHVRVNVRVHVRYGGVDNNVQGVGVYDLGDGVGIHGIVVQVVVAGSIAVVGGRSVGQIEQVKAGQFVGEAGRVGKLRLPQGLFLPFGLVGFLGHLLGQFGRDDGRSDGGVDRYTVVGIAKTVHPYSDGLLVRFEGAGGFATLVIHGPDVVQRRRQPPGRRDVHAPASTVPLFLRGGRRSRRPHDAVVRRRTRPATDTAGTAGTAVRRRRERSLLHVEARRRQRRRRLTRRHLRRSLRHWTEAGRGEGHGMYFVCLFSLY